MRTKIYNLVIVVLMVLTAAPARAFAGEVLVAVAANFAEAARVIADAFEANTGNKVKLSFGSTGKLYSQIAHGAPFEVLLAADQERPQLLEKEGLAVAGSRFTYARGKIVLYSVDPGLVGDGGAVLKSPEPFTRIAIANPQTAPYGEAAVEIMRHLQVYDRVKSRIVQGENIAQAYQFVITENAQLGFVALSQVLQSSGGSRWLVPESLYPPIRQDAVLLARGKTNQAARTFLDFLKGPKARKIIESYGYGLD